MSAGDWKDLFKAACDGDLELVRHHLAAGVDVDHVHPEYQCTILVACILQGQQDAAHLLLDAGADPNHVSELDGLAPLDAALSRRLLGLTARLEEMGAVTVEPQALPTRRSRWWRRTSAHPPSRPRS